MAVPVPLKGKQGGVALVDGSDAPRVLAHNWHKSVGGRYVQSMFGRCPVYLHRFILELGPGQGRVDHANGDTCDNRRDNLRLATATQNLYNAGKLRNNTSGYRGVTWHRARRKWRAQLQIAGKHVHLGYFTDPIQAARAYDSAVPQYAGAFARLNFPEEGA